MLAYCLFLHFNQSDLKPRSDQVSNQIDSILGLDARKPGFGGLPTTQEQISLRIRAGCSAPLLFAF